LVIDLLLSFYGTQRFWFWVCVAFIVVGLLAIGGNLMEPNFFKPFIQEGKRCALEEVAMLRIKKEPQARKSIRRSPSFSTLLTTPSM